MKIRPLRPEFFRDKRMVKLTPHARLLYMALWCIADDEGRGVYDPKTIDGVAFPDDRVDIDALLGELVGSERIVRYEVGEEAYFVIPSFGRHRWPGRWYPSRLPEPPTPGGHNADAMCTHGADNVGTTAVVGSREHVAGSREQGASTEHPPGTGLALVRDLAPSVDDEFGDWWRLYPRKVSRGAALRAFRGARRKASPAELVDGLMRWCAHWHARGTEAQFIPHASTWLHAENWNDDPGSGPARVIQPKGHAGIAEWLNGGSHGA